LKFGAFLRYFTLLPGIPRPGSFRARMADVVLAFFVLLARFGFIIGLVAGSFAADIKGFFLWLLAGVLGGFCLRRSLGLRGRNLTHGFFVRMWERGFGNPPKLLESLVEKVRGDKLTPRTCRVLTSAYEETNRALQSSPSAEERRGINEELGRKVIAALYAHSNSFSRRG